MRSQFKKGIVCMVGGGNYLEKTFSLRQIDHEQLFISFVFVQIDSWDNENATLLVDGIEVWRQAFCCPAGGVPVDSCACGCSASAVALGG